MSHSLLRRPAARRSLFGWLLMAMLMLRALMPAHAADLDPEVNHPHVILAPGKSEKLVFRLLREKAPAADVEAVLELTWPDGKKEKVPLKSGADGAIPFSLDAPETMKPGAVRMNLTVPAHQKELTLTADIMPLEEYARADALASAIRLKEPVRLLFLGDSLTAQRAGSNQVDKLRFWLEKYNPGKAVLRNAAVGGDNIRTVARRLQYLKDPSRKPQYRQETYDQLFAFRPNLVFILLGHNDTKVTSESNYQTPHLGPDQWERGFGVTLDLIAADSGAKVVLFSSVSPVEEVCLRRAASRASEGRVHLLVGQPKTMEQFNRFVKDLAAARGLGFYDLYTPTKNHPNKTALFRPEDGVHLTDEGNRFLALQFLRYFAENRDGSD